jgi:hypothetical protein
MRMLVHVKFPHEAFNAAVKDGTAETKMKRILDDLKPEATYFTEFQGRRSAILIVDLQDASKIAAITEPWFLLFNADCELHAAITPEDLAKAAHGALAKKRA